MNFEGIKSKGLEIGHDIQHRVADQWQTDAAVRRASVNVGKPERIVSGVLGSLLVLLGMRRPGTVNRLVSLAGADLVLRAACGHCNVYKALNFSTVSPHEKEARRTLAEPRLARKSAA